MNEIFPKYYSILAAAVLAVIFVLPNTGTAAETGVLSGQITDIAGVPATGVQVFVYTSSDVKRPTDFLSKHTGGDGKYEVVLPAGDYWAVGRLRMDDALFGPLSPRDKHSGDPQAIQVEPGTETQLDLVVADLREAAMQRSKKREDYTRVVGRIVDASGLPVSMAYLMGSAQAQPAGVPEYLSGWSDSSGKVILYLPQGQVFLGTAKQFPPPEKVVLTQKIDTVSIRGSQDFVIEDRTGKAGSGK